MGITACTNNYYSYVEPLSWTGGTQTITPPKPVYTETLDDGAYQCNAVVIGGTNGRNN